MGLMEFKRVQKDAFDNFTIRIYYDVTEIILLVPNKYAIIAEQAL